MNNACPKRLILTTKITFIAWKNMHSINVQGVFLDYFMSVLHSELLLWTLSLMTTLRK